MNISKAIKLGLAMTIMAGIIAPGSHADDEVKQNVVRDLRYGQSLFYFYQSKYFSAITNLLVAEEKGALKNQGDDGEILLGGLYLGYGMHEQAGEIFDKLIEESDSIDTATKDRAWFYLGKTRYRRGLMEGSELAFLNVTDQLPDSRNDERLNLLANIYLRDKQYDKAIETLQQFEGSSGWKAYAQFNLGVAFMQQGKVDEGVEQLDDVGKIPPKDRELKALRDKANLALGYALIRHKQPEDASKYFKRIRLKGPLSNKALLGIGWAYESLEMHEKALVPWMEIQSQTLLDPAVQEALLAIPYTLEKMQKPKLALVKYNDASIKYENELRRFDAVIAAIQEGELISALQPGTLGEEAALPRYSTKLPLSVTVPYIHSLMASNQFQEAFNKYQDLIHLGYILDRWERQLPIYKLMLKERRKAYNEKLPVVVKDTRLDKYNELVKKRDQLKQELELVMANEDIRAFATEDEADMLAQLDKIGKKVKSQGAAVDIETSEKYRILNGVMLWDLSNEYIPRRWQAQKSLNHLDKALEETQRLRTSLENTVKTAPVGFDEYENRIKSKYLKIKSLNREIKSILKSQELYIKQLAMTEINKQRLRLESYNTRAKFALARLYDNMSKAEGAFK